MAPLIHFVHPAPVQEDFCVLTQFLRVGRSTLYFCTW